MTIHAKLAKQWPELSQQYKAAVVDLASPKAWQETFEESMKKDTP